MTISDNITLEVYRKEYSIYLEDIRCLYESAFPIEERRNWCALRKLIEEEDLFQFYLIFKEQKWVGFFSTWQFSDFIYGEHFAVLSSERGNGIGKQLLEKLWLTPDHGIWVFEVEHPSTPIASRRLRFYESFGAQILDPHYLQPSYHKGGKEVPLLFMGLFADPAKTATYIDAVKHTVYNKHKEWQEG